MPDSKPIRVRLFAQVREAVGSDTLVLPPADVPTAGAVREALVARYPRLRTLLSRSALAVNLSYVADHHPVGAGDDVAVIPPVAGG